jgi:5-(carboxyamino)imidazole ribonucleotide synthase
LGVLGGGQLGRMLLAETQKFDIFTVILDASAEAPCAQICNEFHQGDLLDYDTVYNFGKQVDLLTIEIENVNIDALDDLEVEGLAIFPKPKDLRIIQSKARQKNFYKDNDIPATDYTHFAYLEELKHSLEQDVLDFPFVWKAARFGYDGNGVKIVREYADLEGLPAGECLAEEMIHFKNELAVIVARNLSGDIKTYPVVEMEFHPEANQVEYVICPARIDDAVAEKARNVALKVADALDFVGLLAVEMFQTQDDEILVNEVAPRTHNSGHYTIEASYTSQFEQHLRSILNLPLGNTDSKLGGIMVNLVGAEGHTGEVVYENMEDIFQIPGVTPHIYGKKMTKPFRKMGHVTIVHENIERAREIAERVKNKIKVISK